MYSDIGRSCKARRTVRSLHQDGGWPQQGWFWRHDQRLQMSVRKSRQCYSLFWLCLRCSAIFRFHLFLFSHSFSTSSSSSTYCRISPGWQSSALQIAFSVDSRTAFALLFFRIERFASVMSTSPASSVSPFLRFCHHYVQVDHDHVFLLHPVLRSSGHFPAYRSQLYQRPGTAPEKKVPQSQIPGS